MSQNRASGGVPLPTIGQILVLAAAVSASWLLWSGFGRLQHPEDPGRTSANLIERLRAIDELVERGDESLPELLAMLRSPDQKIRGDALSGLARLGATAAGAAGHVREHLADADPGVRSRAIMTILQIYPDTEAAASIVAPLLIDPDDSVRGTALQELLDVGPRCDRVLAEMLNSQQAAARAAALEFFRTRSLRQPEARDVAPAEVAAVVRSLVDDSDRTVQHAARAVLVVWRLAGPADARELLRSADPAHIRLGLRAVKDLPEHVDELAAEILEGADHLNLETAAPSALTETLGFLSSMKGTIRPAIPRLQRLLETREPEVRVPIARTLIEIGAKPDDVVPSLIPLLHHPSNVVVNPAGRLLVEISPDEARRQVKLLIPKLVTTERSIDRSSLWALSAMRSQARDAIPSLLPLLEHPDGQIFSQVLGLLADIGRDHPAVLAALVSSLERETIGIDRRVACARALGGQGLPAASAIPALLRIVERPALDASPRGSARLHTEVDFQVAAMIALGQIQPADPKVVAALRSQLANPLPKIRVPALVALGRAGARIPGVVADLAALLTDEDSSVRTHAALTIGLMKSDGSAAVPALIAALADENPFVRTAAVLTLQKIGRDAGPALPALRDALADPVNARINSEFGRSETFRRDQYDPSLPVPVPIPIELYGKSVAQAARTAIAEIEAALGEPPAAREEALPDSDSL